MEISAQDPGSDSDTHPPEEALHEAISVHCDRNILISLCPTLWMENVVWVEFLGIFTCSENKADTYSCQFGQSILHHDDRLVRGPGGSSETPAGSS